jgi:aldose 1-epimerase
VGIPLAMTVIKASISTSGFGTSLDGEAVTVFTLTNNSGMTAVITNYGGTIISLTAADRDGKFGNVVLGHKTLTEYESDTNYLGALIGRFGNRIAGGSFDLDGETYTLAKNSGANHLHGGERGFDRVVWNAEPAMLADGPSLLLKYTSVDGEEGYPGNLEVQVRYTLTNNDELRIEYKADTDKATPVNLTSHCYFNLSGDAKRDILEHRLKIAAKYFTLIDSNLIPTGEYGLVDGSPFDFRSEKSIGVGIDADNEQITLCGGYDHNWVFDQQGDGQMRYMATVSDLVNGRVLKVHSTEPGLQFYTGNFLNGSVTGDGVAYANHYGLCLETQHFPDSPNQPAFPSTILQPGEVYATQTIYTFSSN